VRKNESKQDVSDKKTISVEAEEEDEDELAKQEEELEPKSPGHTGHISTSRKDFSGLLLPFKDDDSFESDDEDAEFFGDDDDEAIPMHAAIDVKTEVSEPVEKDKEEKAVV
jgi:hypothetical protein